MNVPTISTLWFDLGEVVLTNDWMLKSKKKDEEFYSYYQITEEQFMNGRNEFITDLQLGKISEALYWRSTLAKAGARTTDPVKAMDIMRKYQREKPGMIKLMKLLKSNGYKLIAVTQIHKKILEWKKRKFHLDRIFNRIYATCDIGLAKPNREIYEYVLNDLDITPTECLYVDDTRSCIDSARSLGIQSIVFRGATDLRKQLREMSVL